MDQKNVVDRLADATSTYNMNFNCCQAVLSAYAEDFALDKVTSLKLSAAFSAGIAYQGKTCGAVLAAYMVIGLLAGSSNPEDELSKEITYHLIRDFDARFISVHAAVDCRELLGKDVSKPEDLALLLDQHVFEERCPKFVADAVRILDQLIHTYKNGKQKIF